MNVSSGSIEFCDVDFWYEEDKVIFADLNLKIQGRSITAIVGETGAGKSSLIKLIPRFYDIIEGSIEIDNQDIRNVSLESLRNSIGIVHQSNHLFNNTILQNLTYGTPNASYDRIIEVSKMVGLHDFIEKLPDGYDTIVREEANRLSQGQQQLISFARALIKDPPILILDEATSSLDVISEIRVQEALEKLIKDRTVIAIAHRLSTIRNADRIIVLENGRIIQDGTHKELVVKPGKYQQLYLKQFLGQESDKFLLDDKN